MKNIKKILAIFVVIILILGTFIVVKDGFKYGMEYREVTELKFMLGQVLDINEVEGIVNDVFKDKEFFVEKMNYFNDAVNISVVAPTDEEVQTLIDKFNERYEQKQDKESVSIVKTEDVKLGEIIKPYIFPSVIALLAVSVFMAIRYKKEGVVKMFLLPIIAVVIVEAVFFALKAILNFPIVTWSMPFALILLVITLVTLVSRREKDM